MYDFYISRSLLTDPFLRTRSSNPTGASSSTGDFFAAGDNCSFPDVHSGDDVRVEHWNNAVEQGRVAARNMLHGPKTPFVAEPYFASDIGGAKIRFVGRVDSFERSVTEGDVDSMSFITFYGNERDEITGVLSVGKDPMATVSSELMRLGKMARGSEIMIGAVNSEVLVDRLAKANEAAA